MTPTPKAKTMEQEERRKEEICVALLALLEPAPESYQARLTVDFIYRRELKFRELLAEALNSDMMDGAWNKRVEELLK